MTRRRNWNSIEGPKLVRFKEAYLSMAQTAPAHTVTSGTVTKPAV